MNATGQCIELSNADGASQAFELTANTGSWPAWYRGSVELLELADVTVFCSSSTSIALIAIGNSIIDSLDALITDSRCDNDDPEAGLKYTLNYVHTSQIDEEDLKGFVLWCHCSVDLLLFCFFTCHKQIFFFFYFHNQRRLMVLNKDLKKAFMGLYY
jgi:hypothetical protein